VIEEAENRCTRKKIAEGIAAPGIACVREKITEGIAAPGIARVREKIARLGDVESLVALAREACPPPVGRASREASRAGRPFATRGREPESNMRFDLCVGKEKPNVFFNQWQLWLNTLELLV
jgi:hypothetical protein